MEQDGHLKTLAERMKEKAEQERIETEKVFTEQLQTLSNNLQESSTNVLHTISDALAQEAMTVQKDVTAHYRILRFAFGKKWICQSSLSMAKLLGMLAGGWGLVKAGEWHLNSYRTVLTALESQCQAKREEQLRVAEAVEALNGTLGMLLEQSSGVAVLEMDGSRYVTAPIGSEPGHTLRGRPAIKLKD